MMEILLRTFVDHIVRKLPPVVWVNCYSTLESGEAKERLYAVLFDTSSKKLRNLDCDEIKTILLDVFWSYSEVRLKVIEPLLVNWRIPGT